MKKVCANLRFVHNRPKPDVLHSILHSKANTKYNARRLWYELNMPECTSEILDGKMLSTSLPPGLFPHTKTIPATLARRQKKKEKRISYMQMRLERENFRKKLVELIARPNTADLKPCAADLDAEFPNTEEKEILRYYYYIKHGIDTIHVAPMSNKILAR
uniref:Uncharacterized protein n=1 Tax=Glossina pallidipes TaxID=7398 RepID=A0A1B0AJP0_GLOPL